MIKFTCIKILKVKSWDWNVISTCVIAVATVCSVIVAYCQWKVLGGQLNEIIIDSRPWVTADLQMAGPFYIDKLGEAQISLYLNLKNVGKLPAKNTQVSFSAFPLTKENAFNLIPDEQKECDKVYKMTNYDSNRGQFLFPGDSHSEGINTLVEADQIKKSDATVKDRYFSIMLVGCVDYTYSSDNTHGQTGFGYELNQGVDGNGSVLSLDLLGLPIVVNKLKLTSDFFHGGILH